MSIFSNMTDRTAMRSFPFLWYIRLVQLVIAFLVLILSAVDAHTVQSYYDGCRVPPKIAYNLACAILAMFVLIYLIFATGPRDPFRSLPWLVWGQLALDGLMWIFWISATATSTFTFQDFCDACTPDGAFYDGFCDSVFIDDYDTVYPRDVSPFPRGLAGIEKRATAYRRTKHTTSVGRTALDAIMSVLFSICVAATIRWIFTQRRSSGTPPPMTKPPAHEESGLPMTSTQQSAPVDSNPQMQPAQYYVVQGQPQQQQHAYQQSAPQGQYPPQPQQDLVYQQQ